MLLETCPVTVTCDCLETDDHDRGRLTMLSIFSAA
jgi:hypothetical protein